VEVYPPLSYTVSMSTKAAPDERPLRADAERNRQRLIEAARELFAQRGLDVTLDDIAHHAGVGVGTAYRRFHDKDDLIDALFEQELERIIGVADAAAAHEDPWEGLVYWLEHLIEMQVRDRGLKAVMTSSARGKERVAAARAQIGPRIGPIVMHAREAGVVRPDLEVGDIPMIVFMVTSAADYAGSVDPDLWRRYLALLLDGLRGDSPLPRPALDILKVTEAMSNWK
jgi:AcrR family transcriptional regulator